ncbi:MAG: HEAT repeat domain-containing protein [Candidatus Poribacteria bacterium]|nr:HEAT repeat domain-containing protein [Candidatus Poribacteria bacterium]
MRVRRYNGLCILCLWSILLLTCGDSEEANDLKPPEDAQAYSPAEDISDWTWGEYGGISLPGSSFIGYHLGCLRFGEVEGTPHHVQFSCGYSLTEALPRHAKHYSGRDIDDGPLEGFEFTGVVLVAYATQFQFEPDPDRDAVRVSVSDILRVAKTAEEIGNPQEIFFENVLLEVQYPAAPNALERCCGEVNPSFILCWDNPQTGQRAYQLMRPQLYTGKNQLGVTADVVLPACETFTHPLLQYQFIQGLSVGWPLLDQYIPCQTLIREFLPLPQHGGWLLLPENYARWIDEALPRPNAHETECIDPESRVQTLIAQLGNVDDTIALHAWNQLRLIGFPAVPPLLEALLSHEDWRVRGHAATALGMIFDVRDAALKREAMSALVQAMADVHEEVRRRAIRGLGMIGDPAAIPVLTQALDDASVRDEAVRALSRIEPREAVAEWIKGLRDGNPQIRTQAAIMLGELQVKNAVPELIKVLAVDPVVDVRLNAAKALGKIGDPVGVPALTEALKDEHRDVRKWAANGLRRIGTPEALKALEDFEEE